MEMVGALAYWWWLVVLPERQDHQWAETVAPQARPRPCPAPRQARSALVGRSLRGWSRRRWVGARCAVRSAPAGRTRRPPRAAGRTAGLAPGAWALRGRVWHGQQHQRLAVAARVWVGAVAIARTRKISGTTISASRAAVMTSSGQFCQVGRFRFHVGGPGVEAIRGGLMVSSWRVRGRFGCGPLRARGSQAAARWPAPGPIPRRVARVAAAARAAVAAAARSAGVAAPIHAGS